MKFLVLIVLSSILSSSASCAKIARKDKAVAYGNVFVEAHGRTVTVYEIERAHILEEIVKLYTPLPIRSLGLINNRFLVAFCRLGSIERIKMWDLKIALIAQEIIVPDPEN